MVNSDKLLMTIPTATAHWTSKMEAAMVAQIKTVLVVVISVRNRSFVKPTLSFAHWSPSHPKTQQGSEQYTFLTGSDHCQIPLPLATVKTEAKLKGWP